ncbi:cupredoxin domain-containing protein [Phytoactinopolyspora limicola]|uniref:cupredoxin domain-containing protein n=1 Tax=Phytoactinopolyspora limicola TaxID=2715536 RepID=UPI00140A208F|nr:cupredoxin domain-containing protein [Phytoactinopolyspora limicola]
MRRRSMIALAAAGALGLAGLAGCGDDDGPTDDAAEIEQPDDDADDDLNGPDVGDEDDPDVDDADVDDPDDGEEIVETITVQAGDLYYEGIPDTLPAGAIQIEFENVGEMLHDIVVEELDDFVVVAAAGGESDVGTVTLEPGEYTFYCGVPGHRPQMEVVVTVE